MPREDNKYRPCEYVPKCGAIDSTHCEFWVGIHTGMVVPSQLDEAKRVGCRVARFADAADEGGPDEPAN